MPSRRAIIATITCGVRLERRSLPSRKAIIVRTIVSLVLAVPVFASVPAFLPALGPDWLVRWWPYYFEHAWREPVIAALAALIAVHVEARYGRRRAVILTLVLAYLGTRALELEFSGLDPVHAWWPYPLSNWVPAACVSLPVIFLQAMLMKTLMPVLIQDAGRVRKPVALLLSVVVFAGWDKLSGAVGSASAGLISALAMLLVVLLAADRAFIMLGITFCAGFLAVSALVQQPSSPELVTIDGTSANVDFRITPPAGVSLDTTGLTMEVTLEPASPTLFGCPRQVPVQVHLDDSDTKVRAQLLRSAYEIDVSGITQITDVRGTSQVSGISQVISKPGVEGATYTHWSGTGLTLPDSTDSYDMFNFNLPVQTWRSMGTCLVGVPNVNNVNWGPGPPPYFDQPAKATVDLLTAKGTSVDLTDSKPQPTDPSYVLGPQWTCYQDSNAGSSANCPAVTAVAVNWASSYSQLAMLLVGTLIAIAAERWFHRVQDRDDQGPPGGSEPTAADGRGANLAEGATVKD